MRKMKSKVLVGFLSLLIATLVAWEGQAQSQEAYPTRPIEIIVPFSAGGGADLVMRAVASHLNKKWGVPVNVVNKPGGNSVPGVLAVYNANPDGYTMLGEGPATSSCRIVETSLPFKILDRTFVSIIGANPHVFVVAADSPFKSLKDLVAEAKRDPKNFTWALTGAGNDGSGVASRQFFKEIGVDPSKTKPVSSPGGSQGMNLVGGGHVILGCTTLSTAVAPLKGGTVRGLAITSKSRHPDWPDVPTTAELGYPNINFMDWKGISGPPKLPAFIVAKWEKALEEISRDPEFIAKMKLFGITVSYLNSQKNRETVTKESDEILKL